MSGFLEFPDTLLVKPRKRTYHAYIQDKPDNDGKEGGLLSVTYRNGKLHSAKSDDGKTTKNV